MPCQASIRGTDGSAAQEALVHRVHQILDQRFDATYAITFLATPPVATFIFRWVQFVALCSTKVSAATSTFIVPNGDNRAIEALDRLGLTFILNSHGHHRTAGTRCRSTSLSRRASITGFNGAEDALQFFDLKVNALALHVGSERILDPFHVLVGLR